MSKNCRRTGSFTLARASLLLACLFAASCLAAETAKVQTQAQAQVKAQIQPLSPYELTYSAKAQGFDVKTVRKVSKKGERYTLTQTSSAMMMQTLETSEFSVSAQGTFTPHAYHYQRKIMGNNRTRQTHFYPAKKLAIFTENGDTPSHVSLPAETYDVLSYQEKLRHELQNSHGKFQKRTLNVLEKDKVRQHSYRLVGEAWLRTPAGYIDTLKIERVRDNSDKTTTIWLAKNWNYVIVRIKHSEAGEPAYTLNLASGTVGSTGLQGLKEKPVKAGK